MAMNNDAASPFVVDLARLHRRVDLHILPIVFSLYLVASLDRNAIASAAVANAEKGHSMLQTLHLSLDEFNWASSAFFFGVVIFEIPSNLLLKYAKPRPWLARISITWSIVAGCTAAVVNYAGLIACRVFLGVCEAGLLPGILYYLTFWYPKSVRGYRVALFWLGGPFASAVGGLLNAAFIQLDGVGSLYGWQWIYVFNGIISLFAGLACLFLLPDYPKTASWLSSQEIQAMQESLEGGAEAGVSDADGKSWVSSEAIAFFKTPISYIFPIIMFLSAVPLIGITIYAPLIVKNLGFNSTAAIALTSPLYFWSMLWLVAFGILADRKKSRFGVLVLTSLISCAGYALLSALASSASPSVKFFLLFVVSTAVAAVGAIIMLWRMDSAQGTTYTALCSAFTLSIGTIGGAVAPQVFRPEDAPGYQVAFAVLAVCEAGVVVGGVVIKGLELGLAVT